MAALALVGDEDAGQLFLFRQFLYPALEFRALPASHGRTEMSGCQPSAKRGTSDLLTWVKSGCAEFEDQRELGAGKHRLRGIEVAEQLFDGLIVSSLRKMVEPDGQCVGGQVGRQIRFGLEDLAQ